MLNSLKIKNFRGFKSLELSGLRRINFVVGANASGKTALLEGIRLALGATPSVALQLHSFRGMLYGMTGPVLREAFEGLWSPFFYDFKTGIPIEFQLADDEGRQAFLKMYFDAQSPVTSTFPTTAGPGAAPQTIIPLVFERKSFDGKISKLLATVLNGQLQLEPGPEIGPSQEIFPANSLSNSVQVASWYSQASTANQEREIVSAVSREFPAITDLTVQAPMGQPASLYATLKNRSRKLPLSLVSSGITKFVATIAAVRQFHDGVVLIDELENGIYFSKLRSIISALHQFSLAARTQLFLTTHSLECLKAAASVIEEAPDDFALIQVFQEDGASRALVVPGDKAAAAIENDIEIRKP